MTVNPRLKPFFYLIEIHDHAEPVEARPRQLDLDPPVVAVGVAAGSRVVHQAVAIGKMDFADDGIHGEG